MPKLTQLVPPYCKHKSSGQAIVKFGGKATYLGQHGTKKSKAEYNRYESCYQPRAARAAKV